MAKRAGRIRQSDEFGAGLLADRCSRGARPDRRLTDGAGGFLPDVPRGCSAMGTTEPRPRGFLRLIGYPAKLEPRSLDGANARRCMVGHQRYLKQFDLDCRRAG
jgi:hypothetical protein